MIPCQLISPCSFRVQFRLFGLIWNRIIIYKALIFFTWLVCYILVILSILSKLQPAADGWFQGSWASLILVLIVSLGFVPICHTIHHRPLLTIFTWSYYMSGTFTLMKICIFAALAQSRGIITHLIAVIHLCLSFSGPVYLLQCFQEMTSVSGVSWGTALGWWE